MRQLPWWDKVAGPWRSRRRPLVCLLAVAGPILVGGSLLALQQDETRDSDQRHHEDERTERGFAGYSAAMDINPTPVASLEASGWDSERLWSRHVDWEPAIAADPIAPYVYQLTTRYNLPACEGCADPAMVFRRSSDGGATWEHDEYLAKVQGSQHDPQIEVALDGTIFVAYLQGFEPGVVFQKSSNLGVTWTDPLAVAAAGPQRWSDKPILVISGDGPDVYIAFNESDSYVVTSHDYGRTFGKPRRTNSDRRYWFHSGGAVAPNGDVHITAIDYSQSYRGDSHINLLKSTDRGRSWTTHQVDTSREMPDCPWSSGCYLGFLGPSATLAIDSAGAIMMAYNAGNIPGGAQQMWVCTSNDGIHWSRRRQVSKSSTGINNAFPALAAGPDPGDFRLAWQDDRKSPTKQWNTWYRGTVDGGDSWSNSLRLSGARSGTAYKSSGGYRFPYGDYLEIAVDGRGANHVIWGEGEGYDGVGGTWFTSNQPHNRVSSIPPKLLELPRSVRLQAHILHYSRPARRALQRPTTGTYFWPDL